MSDTDEGYTATIPQLTPDAFDVHDLEAMQMIINHCSHALGERIQYLEREYEQARRELAAAEKVAHNYQLRSKAAMGFLEWLTGLIQDPNACLDYVYISARAQKVRDAWPDESHEPTQSS